MLERRARHVIHMIMASYARMAVLVAAALSASACGADDEPPFRGGTHSDGGATGDGGGGSIDASPVVDGGSVVVGGDGGTWTCYVTSCGGRVTACGDCTDNDGDGEVDSHDRECLGPCDNTEGPALEGGIGGGGGNSCGVDCYFDFGNGP